MDEKSKKALRKRLLSQDPTLATAKGIEDILDNMEEGTVTIVGKKGDKGDQGIPGNDGKDGKDGKNGINGTNGKDGKNGHDGQDGSDGKDGSLGKDGINGSPDSPQEIVAKINTLEEVIEPTVIKNFPTFADFLRQLKELKGNERLDITNIKNAQIYPKTSSTVGGQKVDMNDMRWHGSGVSTLNGLTGQLNLIAGSNITITTSGTDITISSTGGGGGSFIKTDGTSTTTAPIPFAVGLTSASDVTLSYAAPLLTLNNTSSTLFSTLTATSLVLGNAPFSITQSSVTADGSGTLTLIGRSVGSLALTGTALTYDSAPSGSSGSNFTYKGDTAFGASNLSGGNITIAGGDGTGNGISRIVIQTMGGGSSGGTSSTAVTSNIFSTDGTLGILTGSTAGGKIIGGTSTTADLFLQTTSGVGASGADMHFLVGNNGATEAMTILNAGTVQLPLLTTNGFVKTSGGNGALSVDTSTYTPTSRLINTTSPLAGGGDLSADRTFSIANALADGATKGAAAFNATNFTASAGVVNTIQDIATSSGPQFKTMAIINDGGSASNTFTSYVSSSTTASNQIFRKARGSLASPTHLLDGDTIGSFTFTGFATAFASGAQIVIRAEDDWSVSNRGTSMSFVTVDRGTAILATKILVDNLGVQVQAGVPLSTDTMQNNAAQTNVGGSVSGNVTFMQPEQGLSYKIVMIALSSLNGTASYTYPVAFTQTPTPVSSSALVSLVSSISTTAVTITGTVSTGNIMLIGF